MESHSNKIYFYPPNLLYNHHMITLIAIGYIILPIIIFVFGWLKLPIALLVNSVVLFFAFRLGQEFTRYNQTTDNSLSDTTLLGDNSTNNITTTRKFLTISSYNVHDTIYMVVCVLTSLFWSYLSGTGKNVFQNEDYMGRNPIFRDLCNYAWPVIYHMSDEPDYVQALCSANQTVAFDYYFSWWLPVAGISKLFHLSEQTGNILLWLWTFLGVLLVMLLITQLIGKRTYIIPAVLIFFSGLDYVAYSFLNGTFPFTEHIEWWAKYFQYSSNTTLLFWVFNQTLPIWIVMALFLQLKSTKYAAGLISVLFAYSPWATIAAVPYLIAGSFDKGKFDTKSINPANILMSLSSFIVYGLFYTAGDGANGYFGTIFGWYGDFVGVFARYLPFIFLEFGIYLIIIWNNAKHDKYFAITVAELVTLPLIVIRDYNFTMRGSIPALFILMIYVIRFLLSQQTQSHKRILIVVLFIAALTPATELARVIINTAQHDPWMIKDSVYSFGNMQLNNTELIEIYRDQYFVYDYEDKPFYKFLGK